MVVLQEALILKVMEDFELDPEEISETMAFINSYDFSRLFVELKSNFHQNW